MKFEEWYNDFYADTKHLPSWGDIINAALELGLIPSASNNKQSTAIAQIADTLDNIYSTGSGSMEQLGRLKECARQLRAL